MGSPARLSAFAVAAVLVCVLSLAGCGGGSDDEGTPALSAGERLGEGGALVWTVADEVSSIDPLTAATRAQELLTRQIHEPLIAGVGGPFGDTRRVPGLVRSARASSDATLWTLRLRTGVRFQDGTPFNAQAVLANAARWRTTPAGAEALPGVVDVFAPRFDVVRFILARPDRAFDQRLAAVQLGVVSPRALRPRSGENARYVRSLDTGTGPFELRERSPARQLLARNTSWWGAAVPMLGPALEQIEFRAEPTPNLRLALLDAGDAQLADQLEPDQAELAGADPRLHVLPSAGDTSLGLSRAVRGITSGREIPSLSSAWLADVTVAD